MNLTQLRKRAKYWQDKLGLKHWAIKVVWAKSSELDDSENTKVYGLNTFDPNHMTCLIQVLHPKNAEATYNVEETLIHELLHLFMFPLESAAGFSIKSPTDQWETAMEQAINRLSELLNNGRTDSESSNRSIRSSSIHDGNANGHQSNP
jgi:hypothetical protein